MIDRAPGEDGPEAADRGWLDLSGYADVEPDAVGSAGELAALRGLLRDVPRDVPGWDGMLLRAVTVEPVDLAHEAADAFDEEADAPRSTPTDADEQAAWDVEADEWDRHHDDIAEGLDAADAAAAADLGEHDALALEPEDGGGPLLG